jgi:TetR/AcrR family transcriptional repressor of bet genes
LKTDLEKIRRQDLVKAAYQTFLEYGLGGTTMARIGDRAGMSHGIVNYYFKNKDQLLNVVVRYANCLIMQEVIRRLKAARTPRERLSAVVAGNFPENLFIRETANAWASFYAAVPSKPEFERLQAAIYRRLHSNVIYDLKQLVAPVAAEEIAIGISVWIDGLWLRRAMKRDSLDAEQAIHAVNVYIDTCLAAAKPARRRPAPQRNPGRSRPRH